MLSIGLALTGTLELHDHHRQSITDASEHSLLRLVDEKLGPNVREALAVNVHRHSAVSWWRRHEPQQRREQTTPTSTTDTTGAVTWKPEADAPLLLFREPLSIHRQTHEFKPKHTPVSTSRSPTVPTSDREPRTIIPAISWSTSAFFSASQYATCERTHVAIRRERVSEECSHPPLVLAAAVAAPQAAQRGACRERRCLLRTDSH